VFRLHQKQIVSFRKGRMHVPPSPPFPWRPDLRGLPTTRWVRWLGPRDQIVEYHKPSIWPRWMPEEMWAAVPSTLRLRELRYSTQARGSRTSEATLVTTLVNHETYPAAELAALYARRWEVETNLRHLKQTLGMDVLRTKTVDGDREETRDVRHRLQPGAGCDARIGTPTGRRPGSNQLCRLAQLASSDGARGTARSHSCQPLPPWTN
jgi:hypothetical protein